MEEEMVIEKPSTLYLDLETFRGQFSCLFYQSSSLCILFVLIGIGSVQALVAPYSLDSGQRACFLTLANFTTFLAVYSRELEMDLAV